MNRNPTVAILMATYNGEKFLAAQLDSILAQTYQDFKIYISDDCSTDTTEEILRQYRLKYPDKIFYVQNSKTLGFVHNFEKLLKASQAEYIALCDQDDIWYKHKLEIQCKEMRYLESLNSCGAYLVHSDLSMIDACGKLFSLSYFDYRDYHLKPSKDLGHILGPSGVMGNTILINKPLKKLVLPFPKNLDVHDYWIAVNCELFGRRKTIFKPLVHYRIHHTNSSNSSNVLHRNFFKFSRDIRLPNLETNRKVFLPSLKNKITSLSDKEVLNAYLEYLNFSKNRLFLYTNLIRYDLVKRDLLFRIKLFFKLCLTSRYS